VKLTFDCKLSLLPGAIEIAWRIVNHEPYAIGLFDRIPEVLPDGTFRFSPHAAWVEMDPAQGLLVSEAALPVPPGLGILAYVPPLCSLVGAGAAREETMRLPLPVPEMAPFKRAMLLGPTPGEAVADVPASVSRVTFTVGAFPVTEGVRLSSEHPAFPDVLTASPNAVARQELFARVLDLARPVEVLGYRVAPWP
jgi:hypothetical protein